MRCAALVVLAFLLTLLPGVAGAHKPGDSILLLDTEGEALKGEWKIALRDLEHAIGLDRDGDGVITWGELEARHPAIEAYALARLDLASDGARCPLTPIAHLVENLSDGAYAVLRFRAGCPAGAEDLSLAYALFFELDPLHRGLLQVQQEGRTHIAVLSPDRRTWQAPEPPGLLSQWLAYIGQGFHRIGFDRLLPLR
jgi:hypothetical protein